MIENYCGARDQPRNACGVGCQGTDVALDRETLRALEANTLYRLTKKLVALPPTELGQEILEVIRRRLFVAFQPKQPCDFIVTERVHFSAMTSQTDDCFLQLLSVRVVSDAKLTVRASRIAPREFLPRITLPLSGNHPNCWARYQQRCVMRCRNFHGRFYGLRNFCCKTAQFCATVCQRACLWSALKNTLRNILKNCAKSPL